jgi:phosphoglycolate phosphatase-like HAD superfamily hydrolase
MYTDSPHLFLDFDGTIISVASRHFLVFQKVAARLSLPEISQEIYWKRKRQHLLPWEGMDEIRSKEYRNQFKIESEDPQSLVLDSVIPKMEIVLKELRQSYSLVLLTKRHNRDHLLSQLKQLSLQSLFSDVLTPTEEKSQAIISYGYTPADWVIGDTEEDITSAHDIGLQSIAVTWGLRDEEYLQQYSPTHITETVLDLRNVLLH